MTTTARHLQRLRAVELECALSLMPAHTSLLELGGGDGTQARILAGRGWQVRSVDVARHAAPVYPVELYDGRRLPAADASVDVVFSSNVLEHLEQPDVIHAEIRRVLTPGGVAVHVVPSATWRFFTTALHGPGAFVSAGRLWRDGQRGRAALRLLGNVVPRRHGETGTHVGELWRFSRAAWRLHLGDAGFVIDAERAAGVFYTGFSILDESLSIGRRRSVARVVGSACHVFRVRPKASDAMRERSAAPSSSGMVCG